MKPRKHQQVMWALYFGERGPLYDDECGYLLFRTRSDARKNSDVGEHAVKVRVTVEPLEGKG